MLLGTILQTCVLFFMVYRTDWNKEVFFFFLKFRCYNVFEFWIFEPKFLCVLLWVSIAIKGVDVVVITNSPCSSKFLCISLSWFNCVPGTGYPWFLCCSIYLFWISREIFFLEHPMQSRVKMEMLLERCMTNQPNLKWVVVYLSFFSFSFSSTI